MPKLKVIVIGPRESGKSLISNIIAEMMESDYLRYEPTEGVRILELDHSQKSDSTNVKNLEIELWDCAGSHRFQSCWPAIQLNVHGVIFIYNPQTPELMAELELLYDYFVAENGLTEANCMVLINHRGNNPNESSTVTLPRQFHSVVNKVLNAAGNPNSVKQYFTNFIDSLCLTVESYDNKNTNI